MADLKNANLIWAKGIMFLIIGIIASAMIILKLQDITTTLIFFVAVWAFCRAYYFAFYVIEHYVDSNYRFSGLIDFIKYALISNKRE